MKGIEVVFNIISVVLAVVSSCMVVERLLPKFRQREALEEEKAKELKYVKLDKKLSATFTILAMVCNLIGILIFIFPKVIKNYLQFNYTLVIIFWWLPLIFSNFILYFLFTVVMYNQDKILVKKPFFKQKVYYFSEITSFTETGNLIVKTKSGKFILLNAMAGTNTLREIIKNKLKNGV